MITSRRNLLRFAGASSLSLATSTGLTTALSAFQRAEAADVTGYKALVCVFLYGGMDCHDTVLPYDQTSYDRYAEIRSSLMSFYDAMPGGSTRARNRLLPLTPTNAADFGGRQFALPEELSGIHSLFESGRAAIVGNVGPLVEPLTKQEVHNSDGAEASLTRQSARLRMQTTSLPPFRPAEIRSSCPAAAPNPIS